MSSPVSLRVATGDDVEFLARVVLEANASRYGGGPGWDPDAFARGLVADAAEQVAGQVPDSTMYVVEVDDAQAGRERVGRLRLVRTDRCVEIAGLQVLPSVQNRGHGTAVVAQVIAEATRQGVPVELEVEDDNPDARRLYLRLGFRPAPAAPGAQPDRARMAYPTSTARPTAPGCET